MDGADKPCVLVDEREHGYKHSEVQDCYEGRMGMVVASNFTYCPGLLGRYPWHPEGRSIGKPVAKEPTVGQQVPHT